MSPEPRVIHRLKSSAKSFKSTEICEQGTVEIVQCTPHYTTSPKSWLTLEFPIPEKSESVCALSMEV